jgi:predicted  nucleic acid-binding Zn ribbon protein
VLIGNDYLFTFNDRDELLTKKPLHKTLLTLPYTEASAGQVVSHTHLTGVDDLISATDICTSMLYGKFAKWSQHTVISQNWLSIWDCEKEQLVILSQEAMKKIADHQRQKNKKE